MLESSEFATFWGRYPKKVGRLYAEKCYKTARKQASHADIMAGLERYISSKPAWQEWAHASSWLNAGRWMDEVEHRSGVDRRQEPRDTPERRAYDDWKAQGCPHTPRCGNFATCQVVSARKAS